ncbi:OmpA family protein [Photobacterium sp. TY1-4]|uniref:OmpA family protein n=1 Tax=Photobacterium sp. TY1-4 TaxID=2899122 RepID=UPI0021BF736F|nr:OmpA family protein [Photobacterium sp. TY1-4]UXI04089.1 OmpA family protein [Photobacterium sp. TY1-4]
MRQTVYFDKDSYLLNDDGQRMLDPIAIRLRQHPDSYVIVIGHSDDSGTEEENVVLSYERAFTVAIYIASVFGIEEERIQLVAAGNSDPVTNVDQPHERQRNRRVEVLSPQVIVRTLSPISEPAF